MMLSIELTLPTQNGKSVERFKRPKTGYQRSSYPARRGRTPGPGWRKCTAYLQAGSGGLPLALRLSEELAK